MQVSVDNLGRPVLFIASEEASEAAEKLLRGASRLGVDTESNSMHAFQERTCTIQVTVDRAHLIFDSITLGRLDYLGELFADPGVEKIFHGGVYDLGLLKRDFGFSFHGIFDTALSAELLGHPRVGLAALVEKYCGVVLEKKYTTCDWAQRPFNPGQIEYLYQDTRFLFDLADALREELRGKTLLEEAAAEFICLEETPALSAAFAGADLWSLKGADAVEDETALRVLNQLFLWRQERAAALNRPPFKVIGGPALIEIARLRPSSRAGYLRIKGVTPRLWDRFGKELEEAVQRGMAADAPLPPRPARRGFPDQVERVLGGELKSWRSRTAERLGIGRLAVLPSRALRGILRDRPRSLEELAEVEGMGPARLRKYGPEIVKIVLAALASPAAGAGRRRRK